MIGRIPSMSELEISALAAERWKASVSGARIPTPDAATSMLRSIWSKSDRLQLWPASFGGKFAAKR
jgi:hypothetical protein